MFTAKSEVERSPIVFLEEFGDFSTSLRFARNDKDLSAFLILMAAGQ